jgi:hypothetical protein
LFSSNILPCRKIVLLAGESGVGKTTLSLEFSRMIFDACVQPGLLIFQHTEDKFPDTLPPAVLKHHLHRLKLTEPQNTQAWMNVKMKFAQKVLSQPPVNRVPFPTILDSVSGAQGKERSKKIVAAGAPERDFSENARLLTDWLPDFTKQIKKTCMMPFFVMHLKPDQEGWHTPGGKAKDFFSSYTLYVHAAGAKYTSPTGESTYDIYIQTHKDSYGPGKRQIKVTVSSEFDANGMPVITYHWAETTLDLFEMWLNGDEKYRFKAGPKKGFLDVLKGFESRSAGNKGKVYRADNIADGDWLSAEAFVAAFEANDKVRIALDDFFHIPQRLDYIQYFAKEDADAAAAEAAKRGGKKKAEPKKEEEKKLDAPAPTPQAALPEAKQEKPEKKGK